MKTLYGPIKCQKTLLCVHTVLYADSAGNLPTQEPAPTLPCTQDLHLSNLIRLPNFWINHRQVMLFCQ